RLISVRRRPPSPYKRRHGASARLFQRPRYLVRAVEQHRQQTLGRRLAYAHISDQTTMGQNGIPADFLTKFRRTYKGTLMIAGGEETMDRTLERSTMRKVY